MRGVLVLLMLVALVAAPVAMAADGCGGMGAVCGAACSAPCLSTPVSAGESPLAPVATLAPVALARVPAVTLRTPDAPPKSLLSA
jgi:hypothetical protein